MPKKKTAREMTDEELARRIFPKKVKDALDKIAGKSEEKQEPDSSHR